MQDKAISGDDGLRTNAAQDLHDQGTVLVHVALTYPTHLRLSDLIRELTDDPDNFGERDRIEGATRDLIRVGLLFRSDGLVLPTRAALRAYEVLEEEG
jgi:hypothetical protein